MDAGVRWSKSTDSSRSTAIPPLLERVVSTCLAIIGVCMSSGAVQGQVRGVYPLGMSAVNGGVTPEAGLTYSNLFLFYSRGQFQDSRGAVIATGENSVLMDMNSFAYVTNRELRVLGGAV